MTVSPDAQVGHADAPPAISRRVLVVEDNADSREMLRIVLQLWGHEVEVADDGAEGLRKALEWKPEVAIVDIGLPGLSGFEVAEQVRTASGTKVFLIALTGYSQPQFRRKAFESGFDVHLTKPADLDLLARLLINGHR